MKPVHFLLLFDKLCNTETTSDCFGEVFITSLEFTF